MLVNLARIRFRIQMVVAPFSCLSFITEFVEDSFDVATDFLVLKNEPRGLSDFPGHFFGPGRTVGWFCVVLGLRGSGEG
jgi:hypothetical protein